MPDGNGRPVIMRNLLGVKVSVLSCEAKPGFPPFLPPRGKISIICISTTGSRRLTMRTTPQERTDGHSIGLRKPIEHPRRHLKDTPRDILLRHRVTSTLRRYLQNQQSLSIDTPPWGGQRPRAAEGLPSTHPESHIPAGHIAMKTPQRHRRDQRGSNEG